MLGQSDKQGAGQRRLLSKLLLLCALCAALVLSACAGTTSAGSANGAIRSNNGNGLNNGYANNGNGANNANAANSENNPSAVLSGTPDAQGYVAASAITPAAPADATGSGGNPAAALFGGYITQMTSNGGESVWQVAGRAVHVTSATTINTTAGQPQVGSHVTLGGTQRSDGGVDASWVRVDDAGTSAAPVVTGGTPVAQATTSATAVAGAAANDQSQFPADNQGEDSQNTDSQNTAVYCGYIEQLPQNGIVGDWRVSNRIVRVGQDTLVQSQGNRFDLGMFAFVRGTVQNDGSLAARQIVVRPAANNRCLPGLRVGQNRGTGQGNGAPGRGNEDNGKPGKGNGNGHGNGKGNGNGD